MNNGEKLGSFDLPGVAKAIARLSVGDAGICMSAGATSVASATHRATGMKFRQKKVYVIDPLTGESITAWLIQRTK